MTTGVLPRTGDARSPVWSVAGGRHISSDPEVVLASLNTHGGRGADGRPYDLAAACRQLKADIIALQEVWRPHSGPGRVDEIAAELGAESIAAELCSDIDLRSLNISPETGRGRWGLAVLTTLPVAHREMVDLGRTPTDPIARAALLVTLDVPGGGKLRVANTHLTHKFASPVQLLRLVRNLAPGGVPTVIVGDLNMPMPLTGLAAGYAPAVIGRTFPAHRPLVQLDHILASRRVIRCGGEVLAPSGSDHLPVRARLRP